MTNDYELSAANDYIEMLTEQRNKLSAYAKAIDNERRYLHEQVRLQAQLIEHLTRELELTKQTHRFLPDVVRYAPTSGIMLVNEGGRKVVYTRISVADEFVQSYLDFKRCSR